MDANTLAALRADYTAGLAESGFTADIIDPVETDTELGGRTENPNVVSTVPVDLQSQVTAGRLIPTGGPIPVANTLFMAYVPWNTVILENYRLRIQGRDYEIIDSNIGDTGRYILKINVRIHEV